MVTAVYVKNPLVQSPWVHIQEQLEHDRLINLRYMDDGMVQIKNLLQAELDTHGLKSGRK